LSTEYAQEYITVNSMLHNLHAEHQHRKMNTALPHCSPFAYEARQNHPSDGFSVSSEKQFPIPLHRPALQQLDSRDLHKHAHMSQDSLVINHTLVDEGQCVKEHYEDSNKYVFAWYRSVLFVVDRLTRLLATAFLSRRRGLSSFW